MVSKNQSFICSSDMSFAFLRVLDSFNLAIYQWHRLQEMESICQKKKTKEGKRERKKERKRGNKDRTS